MATQSQHRMQHVRGWLLLWRVDPDDVQVAVVHALLVLVSVTRAPLAAPPPGPGVAGGAGRSAIHAAGPQQLHRGRLHLLPLAHILAGRGTGWLTAM